MYIVKKKKLKTTPQLKHLAEECGRVYSKMVKTFWRLKKTKDMYLSKGAMQKLIKRSTLHSQTVQACIDSFYFMLKAYGRAKKAGYSHARPPTRGRKSFLIQWKGQCLKLKDGTLTIPNGRGNEPLSLPWAYEKPCLLTIKVGSTTSTIHACYKTAALEPIAEGRTVALDLGQIHLATASDGWSVNGKKLRALRRYQNRYKGKLAALQSKKNKGSKAWRRLQHTKRKVLTKLDNQISDFTHKATTGIVSTLHKTGVKTLVIGELSGIRENSNQGKVRNQENHQWNFHQVTWQLTYKAKSKGMEVAKEKEHYTSSTCPCCGERTKTKTRNFVCSKCGFSIHRDLLGAKNILKKYLGNKGEILDFPVVGGMAPPRGVRVKPHSPVASGFAFGNKLKSLETPGF